MYYRLLSPLILPKELDRVLYLDPDILIINSLRPLWELNLDMKVFAATSHTGLTEIANDINHVRLDTEHEYFNSGVMLIDLNAARKLVTSQDVFDCVCSTGKNNLNWTMQNTVVLHFCEKNKRPFTYTTVNGRLFAKLYHIERPVTSLFLIKSTYLFK